MKKFTYLLFAGLILSACGDKSTSENASASEEKCTYSYDSENDLLEWTAFKFTEKTGVKGTFNTVEVSSVSEADSPEDLISSLTFKIPTSTVETQNPERNGKISKFFFGTINTPEITGKLQILRKDGKAGFEITMNGKKVILLGDYTLTDDLFTFKSTLDVAAWDALGGIEALNKECKDLHTSTDGVSKLWPEVEVNLSAPIIKNCK